MNLLAAFLAAAAIGLLYYRVVDAPFIFDDDTTIQYNASLRQLWPLWGDAAHPGPLNPAPELPTSGRPLVNLSFALNFAWGQLDPTSYRVVNFAIHYLNAMLLMLIVRRTLRLPYFEGQFDSTAAFLALATALVWVVHPLQTEAVAYITQRTELMVVFFYLGTFYCAQRYWELAVPATVGPTKTRPNRPAAARPVDAGSRRTRTAWLTLAVVTCAAGMACKEIMVTVPAVVLLYEWTFFNESPRRIARNSWPLYAGLLATWLVLIYLNVGAPRSGSAGFTAEFSPWTWWSTQAKIFWMYLKLAVWPWPLVIHYEYPYLDTWRAAWPWVLPTVLLLVGTLVLLWRKSSVGFVAASVMIILSPTSLIPIVTEMAAERRMYLPLALLIALAIAGGYSLVTKLLQRRRPNLAADSRQSLFVIGAVVIVLTLLGSLMSARRLSAYTTGTPLWEDALIHQPDNYTVNCNLAVSLLRENRNEEALEVTSRATKLWPNECKAFIVQGDALSRLGKTTESIESLAKAVEIQPNWFQARVGLGRLLLDNGRLDESIAQLRAAAQLEPYDPSPLHLWARALVQQEKLNEAVDKFEKALTLDDNRAEIRTDLGLTLVKLGQIDRAKKEFQRVVGQNPNDVNVRFNFARLQQETGDIQDAIKNYEILLRSRPSDFQILAKLTEAYVMANQPEKALAVAEKAVDLARSAGQTQAAEQVENWMRELQARHAKTAPATATTNSP